MDITEGLGDRVVRDPLYGYIRIPNALAPIVDHILFQRLRRVAQTSLTSSVYPSMTGTRFEHALGTMHLARMGWDAAWRNASSDVRNEFIGRAQQLRAGQHLPTFEKDFARDVGLAVAAAGLLHDVGHPPYSHVLEEHFGRRAQSDLELDKAAAQLWEEFPGPYHEFAGLMIARDILSDLPTRLADLILEILEANPDDESCSGALHGLIAGEIDVDRLDYLMRDAQRAGTEFGHIDYQRLIDTLELHRTDEGFEIAPGVRGRSAVETLLVQRIQSYKWIIFHSRVVGANLSLDRAVGLGWQLSTDDSAVRLSGHSWPISTLFQAWPSMNYLSPSVDAIVSNLGVNALGPGEATQEGTSQLRLDDQALTDFREAVRLEARAGVDDSTVDQALKGAMAVARLLLQEAELGDDVRQRLLRFLTYSYSALYRRKNFVACWKTVEEFQGVVSEVADQLVFTVRNSYEQVCLRYEDNEALVAGLRSEQAAIDQVFAASPVHGANHVLHMLFSYPDYRSYLLNELNQAFPEIRGGMKGFWDLAVTTVKNPVRTRGRLTGLYRGNARISLLETSPLVKSLIEVEAARNRVVPLFFLEHPRTYDLIDRDVLRTERERMAGEFMFVLVRSVEQLLPLYLSDA